MRINALVVEREQSPHSGFRQNFLFAKHVTDPPISYPQLETHVAPATHLGRRVGQPRVFLL